MTKNEQYLYIGGVVIILILAAIFALLLVQTVRPVAASEPTPTLYVFPTDEPLPSATPTITASPTATATGTPLPTNTAVPTATVDIEATAQAQAAAVYLELFDSLNQTARLTKQRFEVTFGQLIEGKVDEFDSTWKGEVTALLATFNGHLAQMRGIAPPTDFAAGHDMVIYGMERCSIGWQGMYDATQQGDRAAYSASIPYVHECAESWQDGENMIANLRR